MTARGTPTGKVDVAGRPIMFGDWVAVPWSGTGSPTVRFAMVAEVGRTGKLKLIIPWDYHEAYYTRHNVPKWNLDLKAPTGNARHWLKVPPELVPDELISVFAERVNDDLKIIELV